jgi:hypothetical protein
MENQTRKDLEEVEKTYNAIKDICKTHKISNEILEEYIMLSKDVLTFTNKKLKEANKRRCEMIDMYPTIEFEKRNYMRLKMIMDSKEKLETILEMDVNKIKINEMIEDMINNGFIEENKLTKKGLIASMLSEVNPIVFSEMWEEIQALTTIELIEYFSCFTNIYCDSTEMNESESILIRNTYQVIDKYEEKSIQKVEFHEHLMPYMKKWCLAINEIECKCVIQDVKKEKDIFLGDFVKALLKINSICNEIEKISEITNNISLLEKCKEVPMLTLKYVATNQSLYI